MVEKLWLAARAAGACVLMAALLRGIAEEAGPPGGRAIVHVTECQVEVAIDGRPYWVERGWDTPIVCGLRAGRHRLRMIRDDRVLYDEAFTIRPGQEVILTAWQPR